MVDKIYRMEVYFGRSGDLSGLFVADSAELENLFGRTIYFGEVLGKHSDVHFTLRPAHVTVVSDDADFVSKFIEVMGNGTISGLNPLDYYNPDDWEGDEDE